MRQRNMVTGFDMEQQHSHPDTPPPPMNLFPTFEHYDNIPTFNAPPQYHPHHHHQRGDSNLGPGMSTPPNLYLPFNPPPSHPFSHDVHESNTHFMGQGYKRKSDEAIPWNNQYITEPAPPCSFPHYPTAHPQPIDQRSVRSRVGADPPYSHAHDSFIQGSYGAPPIPPPGPIWYDQHCNDNGSSSQWLQPPSVPFMHGNAAPRYHENDPPFAYHSPNYFSHHLAPPPARPPLARPPPTVYPPRMASASYTAPMTIHDASYSHARPVRSTGLRINQQHPRDGFSPAAALRRHHGLPHLRAFPAYEDGFFGEGDFDDDYVDDYQDMRLDIEDMSYEELLDLSDHIGTVKTGLSEETAKDLVKRRTYISTRINLEEAPPSTDLDTDSCTICQENYKNRDKIVTLDCKHEYHPECLEKWLVIKNLCPICKTEALVMEKNKER
ncbi:hypothetical protein HA466_0148010 [Hirschfeldia incana]|nr:hypothetical protein HA466_0148010 [Hirschfeldia incana]